MATIFEHLDNLTIRKKEWYELTDEDKKSYSPFMMNTYISSSQYYLESILDLNINAPILANPEVHYNCLLATLPDRKLYIKFPKKDKSEYTKDELKHISKYLKLGTKDIEEILLYFPKEKVQEIISKYSTQMKPKPRAKKTK